MARRKIREYDGKKILCQALQKEFSLLLHSTSLEVPFHSILVTPQTDLEQLAIPFSTSVVKPDMLFGKRKQYGLVLLDASPEEAKKWIQKYHHKPFTVGKATDVLTHFLIEPFIAHQKEFYLSLTSGREGDLLQFSALGGAGIEERWNSVVSLQIPTGDLLSQEQLLSLFSEQVYLEKEIKEKIILFLQAIHKLFVDLHFTSLEINPFIFDEHGELHLLDLVAEVDDCASFKNLWPELSFPSPFGRLISPEEEYIQQLDQDSGASLKLTLLNPEGKVWNILSGGGASIISLDCLSHAGLGNEIANYGEYSGNPTPEESYQYAKTVLELMMKTEANGKEGKVLLIAGAIANFTDVEKTFSGIVKALEEYALQLRNSNTKIIVRRGGPNYEKGLELMRVCGEKLGLPMEVYGPEMPLAGIAQRMEVARN